MIALHVLLSLSLLVDTWFYNNRLLPRPSLFISQGVFYLLDELFLQQRVDTLGTQSVCHTKRAK
jgi:hypothetical protein